MEKIFANQKSKFPFPILDSCWGRNNKHRCRSDPANPGEESLIFREL